MSEAMAPVSKDSATMRAWEAYKATDDYKNTHLWATRYIPDDDPQELERIRASGANPWTKELKIKAVEGALWAAFMHGWLKRQPDDFRALSSTKESDHAAPTRSPRTMSLNALAAEIHADNAHWWHDPASGKRLDRDKGEMYMLMVSEVAEAMEGVRKNIMDDHLPHRPMAEVELADLQIRQLDYAGSKGWDFDKGMTGLYLDPMPDNAAAGLLQIVKELGAAEASPSEHWEQWHFCRAFALADRYAIRYGLDLSGAMGDKREYNRHRADHKPAARLAAGGKSF